MSKKSRFRGCFEKQYGKHVQALLKSSTQHIYDIDLPLATKLCSKKSLLLTCQVLGLLVNTLATDEKYPVLNRDNLTIPIQIQLSQKHKIFCHDFPAFLKSSWNFEHFDKKDDAHRFCNFEITHSENVVRKIYKRPCFREPFDKQHGKWAEALLKSGSQHLYHVHWSLPSQLSCKTSLLLTWQILGLVVKKLPAHEKYPVLNRDNLRIPIDMQLSQKQKTLSQFFAGFLKSAIKLKYFEKKVDIDRFCVSEITDSENAVR